MRATTPRNSNSQRATMAVELLDLRKIRSAEAPLFIEIIPAHEVSLAEQAAVFTSAFDGYVGGSFSMDAAALSRFICAQGVDLCYSRFARADNQLVGCGYVTRTGNASHLAGMGVVPAARRRGVARRLLLRLLDEARARDDDAMMLGVIQQNPAAHSLYSSSGFQKVDRLFGWRRAPYESAAGPIENVVEEISLTEAAQLQVAMNFPQLPWQVSPHAVAKLAAAHAFRVGSACIVIGHPNAAAVRVHAISFPSSGSATWADLRFGLSTVMALQPTCEFFTPALFPEEFGRHIFQPLGFALAPISQFLMRFGLRQS